MEVVVYADILFLLNFIIDFWLLALTSIILRLDFKVLRLLTGATVGAIYAVIAFYPKLSIIYTLLGKCVFTGVWVCAVMNVKTLKNAFRALFVFLGISFVLCGTIYLLIFTFGAGNHMGAIMSNGVFYANVKLSTLIISSLITACFVCFIKHISVRNFSRDRIILKVGVKTGEKSAYFNALIDTGCELKDNLTNSPVIIAEFSKVKDLLPADSYTLPFEDVNGGRSEITVFKADKIWIEGAGLKITDKTLIGVTNKKLSYDGLYSGIINPDAIYMEGGDNSEVYKRVTAKNKSIFKTTVTK